jgi:SAM-dependent methyltransferase
MEKMSSSKAAMQDATGSLVTVKDMLDVGCAQKKADWQDPTGTIGEIMSRRRVSCTPEQFHHAVNVAFHEFESEVYDQGHRDMWESLPQQIELLIEDYLQSCSDAPAEIHVLDIGCGTGLASSCLLQTGVNKRIKSIDLLDTSPSMLRRAASRAAEWGVTTACHEGLLYSLAGEKRFELIVASSVLHHVPDLAAFLHLLPRLQAANGIFLHIQDPNGDYLDDPQLRQRMTRKVRLPEWARRLSPWRIGRRIYRELTGRKGDTYIWKTNRALIEKGIISEPLTVQEIFAIVDIHAADGKGISLSQMQLWMPEYDCVSKRSYGFFGELWSKLPPARKTTEQSLIASRAPNGFYVGAIWKLRSAGS